MYKNYIFDLYGTLIDIRTNESKSYLWKKMALIYALNGASYSPSELREEYKFGCKIYRDELSEFSDTPEFKIEKVFARLFEIKGVNHKAKDRNMINEICIIFRAISLEKIFVYDGVFELFNELRKKDKKIFLLSNAQTAFTLPELTKLGLIDAFDGIIISSDVGYAKPDSHIFGELFNKYGLSKENSLFIGNDRKTDIVGANTFGIHNVYIETETSPMYENKDFTKEMKATYEIIGGKITDILKKCI